MSTEETNFIKWFGSIAAILIVSFIIGGVVMFRIVGVLGTEVKHNTGEVKELEIYHKDDVKLIRDDIKDIIDGQKEIQKDIKEILKKI